MAQRCPSQFGKIEPKIICHAAFHKPSFVPVVFSGCPEVEEGFDYLVITLYPEKFLRVSLVAPTAGFGYTPEK